MQRLRNYCRLFIWQIGISYLLLWAVTLWTLDKGAAVFGQSGVCTPAAAEVLFYWTCAASSPLSILANIANVALTVTVWAPVYLAAATVRPEAAAVAIPIIAAHVIGLPLGLLVLIRTLAGAFDLRRKIASRRAGTPPSAPVVATPAAPPAGSSAVIARRRAPPRPQVKPRNEFGLRRRAARR